MPLSSQLKFRTHAIQFTATGMHLLLILCVYPDYPFNNFSISRTKNYDWMKCGNGFTNNHSMSVNI